MTVSIEIKPRTNEVILSLEKGLIDTHKKALYKALGRIGSEVKREAKKLIKNGPKTGRVYMYKGQPHQASAYKQPPANRSGRLMESLRYRTRNHREMTVGAEAEYAGFLEGGTRNMAPRPFLITAVRNKKTEAMNIILESVKQEIGG